VDVQGRVETEKLGWDEHGDGAETTMSDQFGLVSDASENRMPSVEVGVGERWLERMSDEQDQKDNSRPLLFLVID
jgi:hypothetical protein